MALTIKLTSLHLSFLLSLSPPCVTFLTSFPRHTSVSPTHLLTHTRTLLPYHDSLAPLTHSLSFIHTSTNHLGHSHYPRALTLPYRYHSPTTLTAQLSPLPSHLSPHTTGNDPTGVPNNGVSAPRPPTSQHAGHTNMQLATDECHTGSLRL